MIDIGFNFASDAFDSDRDAVVARALDAGVKHFILTGTDLICSESVAELCEVFNHRYPGCFSHTVGIHPHDAKTYSPAALEQLRALASNPSTAAIGETGLDFNRNFSSPEDQQEAFEAQLQLACELKLPVFMHERDAHQRQFEILKAHRDHLVDGVIHCFTGDRRALHNYLDLDLHIGVTGWVCDERRGETLQGLINSIPSDRLMVESDAPYLLPRTMKPKPKSRRNEPAFLSWTIEMIAALRQEPIEEIVAATTDTAVRFFRLQEKRPT